MNSQSPPDAGALDKQRVAAHFDHAAPRYDDHAVLQREVLSRALERLDYVALEPRNVVDLGSGTGQGARALAERYRRARVVHCDLAPGMLAAARRQGPRLFSRHRYACADIERLPFARDAFDLAFSSLAVQWCSDLGQTFAEVHHALRPGGLFLFTTLGPDTLKELRAAFARVSRADHVNAFLDMHDVGDMLGRAGFADPVMETEYITVEYDTVMTLMRDLKGLGAANASRGRPRGLFGRRQLQALIDAYEEHRRDGKLPATWEVVFGHAWATERVSSEDPQAQVFPLSRLKRR